METTQAKEEIGKAYRMFKAFEKAQEVLATLEQIEQTIAEKTKSLEAITSEVDALQTVKDAALAFAKETKIVAISEANVTKYSAESTAERYIANAKSQASSIIAAAKSEVNSLEQIKAQLISENETNAASIEFKKNELDKLQAAIDSHKTEMKKFVG